MVSYLAQAATPDEIAAEDPFGGRGVFLPQAATGEDILDAVERAFGGIFPAVAHPMRGAWVDTAAMGVTPERALARWGAR